MNIWDSVKKLTNPYAGDGYDDLDDGDDLFPGDKSPRRRTPATATATAEVPQAAPAPAPDNRADKVLSTSSNKPGVVLLRPITFSDAVSGANDLKDRKAVIVNLESADRTVARRVVDFLSGCSYALGGQVKKIAAGTYLFCPQNMDIGGDLGGYNDNDSYL